MTAGIVQADLAGGQAAIFVELAGYPRVNGNDVGRHISHKPLWIS